MDIDMIGMGPYLPHKSSPLTKQFPHSPDMGELLDISLKMIAVCRIYLRNVNIAATTALQAIHPKGREQGLLAGANIIMPNLTDTEFRAPYQLYDNKPCIDENSKMCSACLSNRIKGIGEKIGLDEWGDSPHFLKRQH
jgi:biotin synthase